MPICKRVSFLQRLLFLICLSGLIADASDFGTSDVYTASIVAARNGVPVLLFAMRSAHFAQKLKIS